MAKYIYRVFGIPVFTKEVIDDVAVDDEEDDDDEIDIELDEVAESATTEVTGGSHEINTDPIPPMFGFAPHGGMHYNWNE